jgi:hypothetical protein
MQGLRLIVKPVPRESVQRRHLTPVKVWDPEKKTMIDTGQVTGQTKARGAVEVLYFVPNLQKGKYETGLEEMVPNPFKDMEVLALKGKYLLSDEWNLVLEQVIKADKITRQTWYEILDSTSPGYYSPTINRNVQTIGPMRVTSDEKQPRTFIEMFNITLVDGANIFLWDHSRSRMAIQLLKNHVLIAPNREIANPTMHNWYIAQEDEEEMSRVEIDDLENNALFELTSLQRNVPEDRLYKLAVILELARGEMSPLVVKDMLNRYIKSKVSDKKDRIDKFLTSVHILRDQEPRFNVLYAVTQAINVNILYFDAGFLYWRTKTDQAHVYRWKSKDEFINFLVEEYSKFRPKAKDQESGVNYFRELKLELEARGITL